MQSLDGDRPLEPVIVRLEDFAHAAASEKSENSVAADAFGNHDLKF
jgi:hypothetical protein